MVEAASKVYRYMVMAGLCSSTSCHILYELCVGLFLLESRGFLCDG